MHEASVQLFEEYRQKYDGSVDRALGETIQAIALLGLSRTDFFSQAAFYGGTALRLLYNLDRFSEDLDVWSNDYFRHVLRNMQFSVGA